ncbi:DUF6338 family protein [Kangiella marina]|uniref:DUF6338 family protein n=1 Tax=Kangiella marina TaxID=1079178 RepID=A0ABP8IKR0_9GAMM
MDIWELDKLILFLLFVIPGFISIKTYQIVFPGTVRAASDQIVDAIAYSSINYAILFYPITLVEGKELRDYSSFCYYLFYVFVFLLAPILWVILLKYIRTRNVFQKNAPHPTEKPWDFVFAQRREYWVKVTLKNGTVLGGKYASKSFTSSSPSEQEIYLEESWVLSEKGGFLKKKDRSEGVLITSGEISFLEFRNIRG